MIKRYFFAAAILLAGCAAALKPNEFKLTGQVSGYKDSTILYWQTRGSQPHEDSTYIIGNKFQITGTLDRAAQQVLLHVKNTEDYTALWLEKASMTVDLKKGDFDNAKVTGSATEVLNQQLMAETDSLTTEFKKIDKIKGLTEAEMQKMYDENEKQSDVIYARFVEKHPGFIISADYLAGGAATLGRQETQRLYNLLTPEMKATPEGKSVLKYLTLNKKIAIGKPFADFTQYDPHGKPVKLSDFKGNYILLDFWASWCHPCREENPNQLKNYNLYKGKGFKIVAVSVDTDKQAWLAAVKKDGLNYTNVSEQNGGKNTADMVYGITQYPTNYLIDKNGIIIAKDLRGQALGNALKKIYQ